MSNTATKESNMMQVDRVNSQQWALLDGRTIGQEESGIIWELDSIKTDCMALHGLCAALACCLEEQTELHFALAVQNVGDQIAGVSDRLAQLIAREKMGKGQYANGQKSA